MEKIDESTLNLLIGTYTGQNNINGKDVLSALLELKERRKFDYRDLLSRYIALVGNEEGVDFLERQGNHPVWNFTEEELAELKKISAESNK